MFGLSFLFSAALATVAVDITLDKNGLRTVAGGQVSGTGLAAPIPLGNDASPVVLSNLQAGGSYSVDFFQNSGLGGSDFSITINAAGTGVESASLGGSLHQMLVGFVPGDKTLKLNTHRITYNANRGQTGPYYLGGITEVGSITNSEPVTLTVVPGWIRVDNYYNSGLGNEDFSFMVNSDGTVSTLTSRIPDPLYVPVASNPDHILIMNADGTATWVFTNAPSYEDYAICSGATVSPTAARVHFRIEASTNNPSAFVYHSHPLLNATNQVLTSGARPYVYEFDMVLTPGNVGKPCNELGSNTVVRSTAMLSAGPDINAVGLPLQGTTSPGDLMFLPRLRYRPLPNSGSTNAVFYWQNTDGPSNVVSAVVEGVLDDGTPIQMTITATIGEAVR